MKIIRQPGSLSIQSYAKVNLFLEVIGPRGDGYHNLVTIMQEVDLADVLHIEPTRGHQLTFRCEHPDVPADAANLVVRAAELLRERTGSRQGANILLEKHIPVGGGMGGGSSNCAAALVGLNELWRTGLRPSELHALAARLGSDINFFLEGGTAVCVGRGERVRPVPFHVPVQYVLVQPPFPVSTARVFQATGSFLTPFLKDVTIPLRALQEKDFSALRQSLFNRLEEPVFSLYPELDGLKKSVQAFTSGRVLLSGSGSTMFCLCPTEAEAQQLQQRVNEAELGRTFLASAVEATGRQGFEDTTPSNTREPHL